jgi:GxxExxY protein
MMTKLTKSELTHLTYQINGAAIEVHKTLGPGLYEKVYHECLKQELRIRNILFETEKKMFINYKNFEFETDLRCDLIIENSIIVELKSVEEIKPIHEAQLLTYMKLLNIPKGILLNFNCLNLYTQGQKTFVNNGYRFLK